MSPKLDAVDFSWSKIPISTAKNLGIKLVMGYMSYDTTGKNLSSSQIRAYHQAGIGVWLGWESDEGRPGLGAAAGTADGRESVNQLRAHFRNLGYRPRNRISVPFAYDTDVTAGYQFANAVAYCSAAQVVFNQAKINADAGMYGEYDLMNYLYNHGIKKGLFQTYAWSGGQVSPHIALYQYLNNQTLGGASVDLDHIMNAPLVGAWWPPNHPLNHPATPDLSTLEACLMAFYKSKADFESMLDGKNKKLLADITDVVHADNAAGFKAVMTGADTGRYKKKDQPVWQFPGGIMNLFNQLGAHPERKKKPAKKGTK